MIPSETKILTANEISIILIIKILKWRAQNEKLSTHVFSLYCAPKIESVRFVSWRLGAIYQHM